MFLLHSQYYQIVIYLFVFIQGNLTHLRYRRHLMESLGADGNVQERSTTSAPQSSASISRIIQENQILMSTSSEELLVTKHHGYPTLPTGSQMFTHLELKRKASLGRLQAFWDISTFYAARNVTCCLAYEYIKIGDCEVIVNPHRQVINLQEGVRSYEIGGLLTWRTVRIVVIGVDNSTDDKVRDAVSETIMTHDQGTVQGITLNIIGPTLAELSWQPPSCADRGGIKTGYDVEMTFEEGPKNLKITSTMQEKKQWRDLVPYTKYLTRIRYRNSQGPGPWSMPFGFQTSKTVPSDPNFENYTNDEFSIGLQVFEPVRPNGNIELYQIQLSGGSLPVMNLNTRSAGSHFIVDGLRPNTTYSIKIRAKNEIGWGKWSILRKIKTCTETDMQPLYIRQTLGNGSCIGITWGRPAKITGVVVQYMVEMTPYNIIADKENNHVAVYSNQTFEGVQCGLEPYRITDHTITVKVSSVKFDDGPISGYELRLLKLGPRPSGYDDRPRSIDKWKRSVHDPHHKLLQEVIIKPYFDTSINTDSRKHSKKFYHGVKDERMLSSSHHNIRMLPIMVKLKEPSIISIPFINGDGEGHRYLVKAFNDWKRRKIERLVTSALKNSGFLASYSNKRIKETETSERIRLGIVKTEDEENMSKFNKLIGKNMWTNDDIKSGMVEAGEKKNLEKMTKAHKMHKMIGRNKRTAGDVKMGMLKADEMKKIEEDGKISKVKDHKRFVEKIWMMGMERHPRGVPYEMVLDEGDDIMSRKKASFEFDQMDMEMMNVRKEDEESERLSAGRNTDIRGNWRKKKKRIKGTFYTIKTEKTGKRTMKQRKNHRKRFRREMSTESGKGNAVSEIRGNRSSSIDNSDNVSFEWLDVLENVDKKTKERNMKRQINGNVEREVEDMKMKTRIKNRKRVRKMERQKKDRSFWKQKQMMVFGEREGIVNGNESCYIPDRGDIMPGEKKGEVDNRERREVEIMKDRKSAGSKAHDKRNLKNYGGQRANSRKRRRRRNVKREGKQSSIGIGLPGTLWLDLRPEDVQEATLVVIGDGQYVNGQLNRPVNAATEYAVLFVVKSTVVDTTKHNLVISQVSAVTLDERRVEKAKTPSPSIHSLVLTLAIVIPIFILLLFCLIMFAVRYCVKKYMKKKKKKKSRNMSYDEFDEDFALDGGETTKRRSSMRKGSVEDYFTPIMSLDQSRHIPTSKDKTHNNNTSSDKDNAEDGYRSNNDITFASALTSTPNGNYNNCYYLGAVSSEAAFVALPLKGNDLSTITEASVPAFTTSSNIINCSNFNWFDITTTHAPVYNNCSTTVTFPGVKVNDDFDNVLGMVDKTGNCSSRLLSLLSSKQLVHLDVGNVKNRIGRGSNDDDDDDIKDGRGGCVGGDGGFSGSDHEDDDDNNISVVDDNNLPFASADDDDDNDVKVNVDYLDENLGTSFECNSSIFSFGSVIFHDSSSNSNNNNNNTIKYDDDDNNNNDIKSNNNNNNNSSRVVEDVCRGNGMIAIHQCLKSQHLSEIELSYGIISYPLYADKDDAHHDEDDDDDDFVYGDGDGSYLIINNNNNNNNNNNGSGNDKSYVREGNDWILEDFDDDGGGSCNGDSDDDDDDSDDDDDNDNDDYDDDGDDHDGNDVCDYGDDDDDSDDNCSDNDDDNNYTDDTAEDDNDNVEDDDDDDSSYDKDKDVSDGNLVDGDRNDEEDNNVYNRDCNDEFYKNNSKINLHNLKTSFNPRQSKKQNSYQHVISTERIIFDGWLNPVQMLTPKKMGHCSELGKSIQDIKKIKQKSNPDNISLNCNQPLKGNKCGSYRNISKFVPKSTNLNFITEGMRSCRDIKKVKKISVGNINSSKHLLPTANANNNSNGNSLELDYMENGDHANTVKKINYYSESFKKKNDDDGAAAADDDDDDDGDVIKSEYPRMNDDGKEEEENLYSGSKEEWDGKSKERYGGNKFKWLQRFSKKGLGDGKKFEFLGKKLSSQFSKWSSPKNKEFGGNVSGDGGELESVWNVGSREGEVMSEREKGVFEEKKVIGIGGRETVEVVEKLKGVKEKVKSEEGTLVRGKKRKAKGGREKVKNELEKGRAGGKAVNDEENRSKDERGKGGKENMRGKIERSKGKEEGVEDKLDSNMKSYGQKISLRQGEKATSRKRDGFGWWRKRKMRRVKVVETNIGCDRIGDRDIDEGTGDVHNDCIDDHKDGDNGNNAYSSKFIVLGRNRFRSDNKGNDFYNFDGDDKGADGDRDVEDDDGNCDGDTKKVKVFGKGCGDGGSGNDYDDGCDSTRDLNHKIQGDRPNARKSLKHRKINNYKGIGDNVLVLRDFEEKKVDSKSDNGQNKPMRNGEGCRDTIELQANHKPRGYLPLPENNHCQEKIAKKKKKKKRIEFERQEISELDFGKESSSRYSKADDQDFSRLSRNKRSKAVEIAHNERGFKDNNYDNDLLYITDSQNIKWENLRMNKKSNKQFKQNKGSEKVLASKHLVDFTMNDKNSINSNIPEKKNVNTTIGLSSHRRRNCLESNVKHCPLELNSEMEIFSNEKVKDMETEEREESFCELTPQRESKSNIKSTPFRKLLFWKQNQGKCMKKIKDSENPWTCDPIVTCNEKSKSRFNPPFKEDLFIPNLLQRRNCRLAVGFATDINNNKGSKKSKMSARQSFGGKAIRKTLTFYDEYQALETYKDHLMERLTFEKAKANPEKNRFPSFLPPDHSLVTLEASHRNDTEYYNASFINPGGHDHPTVRGSIVGGNRRSTVGSSSIGRQGGSADYGNGGGAFLSYIAAQSPFNAGTVEDFWKIVVKYRIETIVMMCNDTNIVKPVEYWDEDSIFAGGLVIVRVSKREDFANFVVRTMEITSARIEDLTLTHFQYTTWPVDSVPYDPMPILDLRYRVRLWHGARTSPLLVHCDTGSGKSAVFIAVDALIDDYSLEGYVSLFKFTKWMRKSRPTCIRTFEGYRFVYECILEEFQAGDTMLQQQDLCEQIDNLLNQDQAASTSLEGQFKQLQSLTPKINLSQCTQALKAENRSKNRYAHILPLDILRPRLSEDDNSQSYINAIFVDGARRRNEFIITQHPLPNTISDFWKMIYDHKVQTIITLGDLASKDSPEFWPTSGSRRFNAFTVEFVNEREDGGITVRNIKLWKTKEGGGAKNRAVRQFHLDDWETESPSVSHANSVTSSNEASFTAKNSTTTMTSTNGTNEDDLKATRNQVLHLLDIVMEWQTVANRRSLPIVVHDRDGSSPSGLVCASAVLCEKLRLDGCVDVYHTLKHMKCRRPTIGNNLDEYQFLHQILCDYHKTLQQEQSLPLQQEIEREDKQQEHEEQLQQPEEQQPVKQNKSQEGVETSAGFSSATLLPKSSQDSVARDKKQGKDDCDAIKGDNNAQSVGVDCQCHCVCGGRDEIDEFVDELFLEILECSETSQSEDCDCEKSCVSHQCDLQWSSLSAGKMKRNDRKSFFAEISMDPLTCCEGNDVSQGFGARKPRKNRQCMPCEQNSLNEDRIAALAKHYTNLVKDTFLKELSLQDCGNQDTATVDEDGIGCTDDGDDDDNDDNDDDDYTLKEMVERETRGPTSSSYKTRKQKNHPSYKCVKQKHCTTFPTVRDPTVRKVCHNQKNKKSEYSRITQPLPNSSQKSRTNEGLSFSSNEKLGHGSRKQDDCNLETVTIIADSDPSSSSVSSSTNTNDYHISVKLL